MCLLFQMVALYYFDCIKNSTGSARDKGKSEGLPYNLPCWVSPSLYLRHILLIHAYMTLTRKHVCNCVDRDLRCPFVVSPIDAQCAVRTRERTV